MAEIADETVTAYLDGVLDEAATAAVEAAMASDPALAAKVARERQLRRVRSKAPAAPGGEIIRHDFRKPRTPPPPPAKPKPATTAKAPGGLPAWVPAAAAVVIGLLVVQAFGMVKSRPFQAAPQPGAPASGALVVALDRKLSGEAGLVQIGSTFGDNQGVLCRTFRIESTAGVACYEGAGWKVRMTAPATTSIPQPVTAAAAGMMAGPPLSSFEEVARRKTGWATPPFKP
ncbi:hypothetical protein [Phenylobacterium sp.]|uniref:hypothetical protein n=1 Tax=Phenylobacterium sp. TaxID=1871053 RepID=UPI00286B8739|nr:hypothetical protein [Phenylobacterium sp.]